MVTIHAQRRMAQRAITPEDIALALEYGASHRSHGCVVYTLTDRALERSPAARCADRLRGLSVVTDGDSVITTKWDYSVRRAGKLRRSVRLRAA